MSALGSAGREGRCRKPTGAMAGCGFDAYFVPQDCVWPLKKTVRPRVKLRAVYE